MSIESPSSLPSWFAGVHSNVGGSYPESGLSDVTLLWMMGKAEGCGLAVDGNQMANVNNPRPDPLAKVYNSQTIWYKIAGLGDYIRPIGAKTQETVASTAVARQKKCCESVRSGKPQELSRSRWKSNSYI